MTVTVSEGRGPTIGRDAVQASWMHAGVGHQGSGQRPCGSGVLRGGAGAARHPQPLDGAPRHAELAISRPLCPLRSARPRRAGSRRSGRGHTPDRRPRRRAAGSPRSSRPARAYAGSLATLPEPWPSCRRPPRGPRSAAPRPDTRPAPGAEPQRVIAARQLPGNAIPSPPTSCARRRHAIRDHQHHQRRPVTYPAPPAWLA